LRVQSFQGFDYDCCELSRLMVALDEDDVLLLQFTSLPIHASCNPTPKALSAVWIMSSTFNLVISN
jgi:hypothetical protein